MGPLALAIASGVAQVGLSFVGDWIAGAQDEEELQQRLAALEEYTAFQPPEHRELIAREVARSSMEDVTRNQRLEATQDEVLGRLMEVGRTGESARARAEYEQAAQESSQLERAARAYAVAQASALGLGPEAAYMDALIAGQAGADRERMAGLQRAAFGEEMRLGALGQAGSMAERRSATQWNQDADVARARDELARFNAGEYNDMQRYNRDDELRVWDRDLALRDRRASARGDIADMHSRRGQQTRDRWGNIATGTGRAIMAPGAFGPPGGIPGAGGGVPPAAAPAAAPPPPAPSAATVPQQQRTSLPYDDPRRRRLR